MLYNDPTGPNTSLLNTALDYLLQRQTASPIAPAKPDTGQGDWEQSVDRAKVSNNLDVHDLGLIIFNETQSYTNRPDSNEPIDAAREKLAHSIINADQKWGAARQTNARTALPIEPSAKALENPTVRAAYDSSMQAAREAYLSGSDPTNGAVHLNQRGTPDRSNLKFADGNSQGVPLSTQSGPYNNSYTKGQVSSKSTWLNTYWDK